MGKSLAAGVRNVMTDDASTIFEFDIALSFAGEDRAYVADVADRLRGQGIRVFYDQYEQATLWGKNLYDRLDYVYRRAARYCILFISEPYANKVWTNHERQSAQARALEENREYVLPVRFDDTEIPGLRSTIGYIDARHTTPDYLVQLILQKLGDSPSHRATTPAPVRVPRTPEQQRQLLAERPPHWEYLLFAGVLAQGKEALEPKWRDHQLRYARVTGQSLDDSQVGPFIVAAMNEPVAFAANLSRVFDRQAKELAFGPPGVPGDPARIEHLGHRFVAIYEDFLDWSARLRGTVTSSKYRRLLDLAASTADMPAKQIRDFTDHHVATLDRLPELLAEPSDEPIDLTFVIELDADRRIIAEYNREFKRLRRRGAFG
jgi:hypothetical protein